MRKMSVVLLAAVFLAGVSGVLADDVKSVNAVGYVKTQVPDDEWVLISLPFMSMGDNVTFTINDIIPAANEIAGTEAWYYRGGEWLPETLVKVGPNPAAWDPGTNEFLRGQDALFVKVNVSGGGSHDLTVLGEVPGDNNLGQTTTVVVAENWTLLGFGYPVDVLVTNTALDTIAELGDEIWTWDPDLDDWVLVTTRVKIGPNPAKWDPAEAALLAGRGYFYNRAGALANWVQDKKYDEP